MQSAEIQLDRKTNRRKLESQHSRPLMKIAYLEDDKVHGAYLANWLQRQAVSCEVFANTTDFVDALDSIKYDLILLDWEIDSNTSGLDMLRRIRKSFGKTLPVIFVSSRNTREAVLTAIRHGADDYIAKPVHRSELLKRIHSLTDHKEIAGTTYQFGPYLIDRKLCHVYRNGKAISLAPREYQLALTMLTNPGKIMSHEQLLNAIGGEKTLKPYNEIEYLLYMMKKKLKFKEHPQWRLDRVGDIGFRLTGV